MKFLIKIYRQLEQELNRFGCNKPKNPALLISCLYAGFLNIQNMSNIVTYKIKYTCKEEDKNIILDYMRRYNNLLKCTYNYAFDNNITGTKDLWNYQKSLNNITNECGFKQSAISQTKQLIKQGQESLDRINKKRKQNNVLQRQQERKICFGGKKLYKDYNKGLITKEEFKVRRLFPIYCVGETQQKANRHFRIQDNKIIFQPTRKVKIDLQLNLSKSYKKDLEKLYELQENKLIPITCSLDLDYIYLTFDVNFIKDIKDYNPVYNRYISIDMNPNYIGYVVCDWKGELDYKIIDSGVISIENLTNYENSLKGLSSTDSRRKYITNKRNFEICKIAQNLVNLTKHYKCEIFGLEDLSIEPKDGGKGRGTNRLINNQWNRNKLIEQINKHCKLNKIKIWKVNSAYTSFIGNLGYRQEKLPDMCLSALEINRRVYELDQQYNKKTKEIKKNIIFPDVKLFQKRIEQALEEIGYISKFDSWQKLYFLIKKSKQKYRLLLNEVSWGVSSLFSTKSYLTLYKGGYLCTK